MSVTRFVKSFKYAWAGIIHTLQSERNMRIHVCATVIVGLLAWYLKLSSIELLILVITVALVLITELINTAVERVVDMVSPDYSPLAEFAKNAAAGAVLLAAAASLVVGYFLFFKKLWG